MVIQTIDFLRIDSKRYYSLEEINLANFPSIIVKQVLGPYDLGIEGQKYLILFNSPEEVEIAMPEITEAMPITMVEQPQAPAQTNPMISTGTQSNRTEDLTSEQYAKLKQLVEEQTQPKTPTQPIQPKPVQQNMAQTNQQRAENMNLPRKDVRRI